MEIPLKWLGEVLKQLNLIIDYPDKDDFLF
jgi:hypothetical protein